MNNNSRSKLILVEGLTGSGKSIMAHMLARQLQHNGISATWLHEGELAHPLAIIEDESDPQRFGELMRQRWQTYIAQLEQSNQVCVVEACFFNNLLETLFTLNLNRGKILEYSDEMQALLAPLNPTLIYLVQNNVEKALKQNFERRGDGFRDFVVEYATETAVAKKNGWMGYEGMAQFWQEFVSLTDDLYEQFQFRKCKIDNTAGNWDIYNRQALECLQFEYIPEKDISQQEAKRFVGTYQDIKRDKTYTLSYEKGKLTIDLFLEARTNLVKGADRVFLTEGWHFEIRFDSNESSEIIALSIAGKDVEYLALVGTIAKKEVHV